MRDSLALVSNIIISLEPRYAEAILAGEKIYELRRRQFRVENGTKVWLYAKKPLGAVVGVATISKIHASSPTSVWRRFGSRSGVLRQDFYEYFADKPMAYAIELQSQARLSSPVSLSDIKAMDPRFHPPQFFKRFSVDDSILKYLLTSSRLG